jgi:hypothetical protein
MGKWVDGKEVKGVVLLEQFPHNFTLLFHAGISGLIFVSLWVYWHRTIWSTYNNSIFAIVLALFLLLTWVSGQVANNISDKKLTFGRPSPNFDWVRYARSRMKILILIFSINGSVLIWGTGGLSSPFIPFYIMVFSLAFTYCGFPQPATSLTIAFVGTFLAFIILAEISWFHSYIPAPVDAAIQQAIDSNAKKFFDGGFVTASMLVPLISMFLADRRNPSQEATPPKAS